MTEATDQAVDITPKRSNLAVTSLILGILSLFSLGLLSIPCLVCGHLANRRIKKRALTGKRLALAGLIMGYIGVLLFAGSAYWSSTRPIYRPYTLPDGKTIKLIALQKWMEVGNENSIALIYQTDIELNLKDELKEEAQHIWQYLKVNAEREDMTKGRIFAQGPATGRFVKKRSQFGFLIEKQEDGTWKFSDPLQ